MKYKPWSIIVLALLHVLAPLGNLLLSSLLSGVSVWSYLKGFNSFWDGASFFVFFPIAGAAIYQVRKWSYPVFLGVMIWAGWLNFLSWSQHPERLPLPFLIGLYAVNIAVVSYFLIPAVRLIYFTPRMRWWEAKPRFQVDADAIIEFPNGDRHKAMVVDLSVGGVFINVDAEKIQNDDTFQISFSLKYLNFNLPVRAMHITKGGKQEGCGAQFQNLNFKHKRLLCRVTRGLELLAYPRRPERQDRWEEFLEWGNKALKTGRGIVPEIPESFRTKK